MMHWKRTWTCVATSWVLVGAAACQSPRPSESVSDAWEKSETRSVGDGTDEAANDQNRSHTVAARKNEDAASSGNTENGSQKSPAAVAVVNDRSIAREWLVRELIASHGLDLLAQRIALEVVRQEAQRASVSVTPADIDAEYDHTLRLGAAGAGDVNNLTAERRKQLIEQWRTTRGVSVSELQMAMERQALLRKIVGTRLVVNEQKLQEEFARVYGTKVECRHIVVASLREAERLKPSIDAGEDFAVLARRYSLNEISGSNGGMLPPFSAMDETVPGVLREAAFQMSPGQVSNPIKVDGQHHLLKLERRLAPDVVKFESVRDAVERSLRERLTPMEMEKLFTGLQQQASLRIEDATLRAQYQQRLREGRLTGPALK